MLDSGLVPQTASVGSSNVPRVCGGATLLLEVHNLSLFSAAEELTLFFDGGKYAAYLAVKSLSFTPRAPGA